RAVAVVRRHTGAKAGHAGTLDPLATGVLPVALGEATKTIGYAIGGWKRYRFRIRWGIARSGEDGEGEIVGETGARPSIAAIEAALPCFIGTIWQVPPAHSAIRIAGRRAYTLARAGRTPALAARPVEISALRLVAAPDADHADFEATVGKGTYIRALARDLAAALGTLGHVAALRRLAVGRFTEAQAISLETVASWRHIDEACGYLLPIESALDDIPAVVLAASEAARLRLGQCVMPCDPKVRAGLDQLGRGSVVGAWREDALVAFARIEAGGLQAVRVLNR
ncbi:MAG TPA: tRNA pseudouridine(55) synthase TruB, partial [Stellaceae bacterium]|nr:tRNA pseudouridine(55) synthase TruB [Stellaceae bacterium]